MTTAVLEVRDGLREFIGRLDAGATRQEVREAVARQCDLLRFALKARSYPPRPIPERAVALWQAAEPREGLRYAEPRRRALAGSRTQTEEECLMDTAEQSGTCSNLNGVRCGKFSRGFRLTR
jgi:hypothetical protein